MRLSGYVENLLYSQIQQCNEYFGCLCVCVKIQIFFVKLTIPFGSIISNNMKRKHCNESVTVNLETLWPVLHFDNGYMFNKRGSTVLWIAVLETCSIEGRRDLLSNLKTCSIKRDLFQCGIIGAFFWKLALLKERPSRK